MPEIDESAFISDTEIEVPVGESYSDPGAEVRAAQCTIRTEYIGFVLSYFRLLYHFALYAEPVIESDERDSLEAESEVKMVVEHDWNL